jgi:hypothetical protein
MERPKASLRQGLTTRGICAGATRSTEGSYIALVMPDFRTPGSFELRRRPIISKSEDVYAMNIADGLRRTKAHFEAPATKLECNATASRFFDRPTECSILWRVRFA